MKRAKREKKGWDLPATQELQKKLDDPEDTSLIGSFVGAIPHMRASMKMEKYDAEDERIDPEDCHHTQFLDVSFPVKDVWCLDCGSRVRAGSWDVMEPNELTDEQLQEKRDLFHSIWGLQ
jgi:hypothetical protein